MSMGRDRLDTSRVSADLLVVEGTVSEASINIGEEDIIIVEKEKHRAKSTEKSVSRNHHCERNCGIDRKKLDCAILSVAPAGTIIVGQAFCCQTKPTKQFSIRRLLSLNRMKT